MIQAHIHNIFEKNVRVDASELSLIVSEAIPIRTLAGSHRPSSLQRSQSDPPQAQMRGLPSPITAHAPTSGPRAAASSLLAIPATLPQGPSVALRWLARMSREEQLSCFRGTLPGPPRGCSASCSRLPSTTFFLASSLPIPTGC